MAVAPMGFGSPKKKLTPKQKKIANAADPKDKITGADFKALKKKKATHKKKSS